MRTAIFVDQLYWFTKSQFGLVVKGPGKKAADRKSKSHFSHRNQLPCPGVGSAYFYYWFATELHACVCT